MYISDTLVVLPVCGNYQQQCLSLSPEGGHIQRSYPKVMFTQNSKYSNFWVCCPDRMLQSVTPDYHLNKLSQVTLHVVITFYAYQCNPKSTVYPTKLFQICLSAFLFHKVLTMHFRLERVTEKVNLIT